MRVKEIRKMTQKGENNDDTNGTSDDENIISSQDMIFDARARRNQKEKLFICEKC